MAKLVTKGPTKKTPAQKLGKPMFSAKPVIKTPREKMGGKKTNVCK